MGCQQLSYYPEKSEAEIFLQVHKGESVKKLEAEKGGLNYYPFGMSLVGRNYQSPDYRYGFNGKERDDEGLGGGGATYDYGFRIYNAQIGKFLSVDPLFKGYPYYTPYQFAGNMPVWAIDLDGLEEYIITYWRDFSTSQQHFTLTVNSDIKVKDPVFTVHRVDKNGDDVKMTKAQNKQIAGNIINAEGLKYKAVIKKVDGEEQWVLVSHKTVDPNENKTAKWLDENFKFSKNVTLSEAFEWKTPVIESKDIVIEENEVQTSTQDNVPKVIIDETPPIPPPPTFCSRCFRGDDNFTTRVNTVEKFAKDAKNWLDENPGQSIKFIMPGNTNQGWNFKENPAWDNAWMPDDSAKEKADDMKGDIKFALKKRGVNLDRVKFEYGKASSTSVKTEAVKNE